ncbi:MAG: hypothetical protein Q9213_003229 [Squamulea squamosa]
MDNYRRVGNNLVSKDLINLADGFADIALRSAPALIDAIWPGDGSPIGDVDHAFSAPLEIMMSRIPRFVAFASGGQFSYNDSIADPLNATAGLSLAASTLFTTTALLQNGFTVVVDADRVKDSKDLIPPGGDPNGCTALDDGHNYFGQVCSPLNGSSVSGARYWSARSSRVYNFMVNGTTAAGNATLASGKTNAKQALLDIYNEGYADMDYMFDDEVRLFLESALQNPRFEDRPNMKLILEIGVFK